MHAPTPPWILSLLLLQGIGIALILVALPLVPPATGRLLLIPLGARSGARLAADALAGGGRLIDRGPIAGSLIVDGDRTTLAAALGRVLILAAPQSGCGRPGAPA